MKKFNILIVLSLYFLILPTFAQKINKVRKVEGTALVKMESDMTFNDTRKFAEELAKIDALQNAFGTIVNQEFNMMIKEGKADFNIMAKTEVKGEWIETTDIDFSEDFRTEETKYGDRSVKWITCNIKGKARKSPTRAVIGFYPLNCTKMSCMTTEFVDGADLFLSFTSPVDGYLSVFLDNGNKEISRLLPDKYTQKEEYVSGIQVKGDKEYIFFSPDHNFLTQEKVEEYIMFTNEEIEYNYLYVVFSRQPFIKPILQSKEKKDGLEFPKTLTSKEFQEWESENKYKNLTFQEQQMAITIKAE